MTIWMGCVAVCVIGFGLFLAVKPDGAVAGGLIIVVSGITLGTLAFLATQRPQLTYFDARPPAVAPARPAKRRVRTTGRPRSVPRKVLRRAA
jgi:hypothetical protein